MAVTHHSLVEILTDGGLDPADYDGPVDEPDPGELIPRSEVRQRNLGFDQ